MKKRNGRITVEMDTFVNYDSTAYDLLQQFLQAKKAINLSRYTIIAYRMHCSTFIDSLADEANELAWKSCTLDNYYKFIIALPQKDTSDVTIASYARSIRA